MKNKTKMDINCQFELTKRLDGKNKKIFLFFGTIFILLGLYTFSLNRILAIVFLGFGVWDMMFAVCYNQLILERIKKSNLLQGENYYEFKKDDTFTIISTLNDQQLGIINLMYSDILKVLEIPNYLFLFTSSKEVYPISKCHMIEGNINDLVSLLKLKVIDYKVTK